MTAKPDKWQGIEKLADDLHGRTTATILRELRRALEPLLEAAENAVHLTMEPGRTLAIAQLKERLDTWRKR